MILNIWYKEISLIKSFQILRLSSLFFGNSFLKPHKSLPRRQRNSLRTTAESNIPLISNGVPTCVTYKQSQRITLKFSFARQGRKHLYNSLVTQQENILSQQELQTESMPRILNLKLVYYRHIQEFPIFVRYFTILFLLFYIKSCLMTRITLSVWI